MEIPEHIRITDELDEVEADDLHGFFEGWPSHPTPTTHLQILRNSHAVALAVDTEEGRVVGFANAVSDGVLSAYIPLLEVLPDWRGRGIGRGLIERLCSDLEHLYMIDLLCDPELESFYEPLGFRSMLGMGKRNYENQTGHADSE